MRMYEPAAVDTMGADALASSGQPDDKCFRFQTLVATMLSPQTKDEQTSRAFNNILQLVNPNKLLPSTLLEVPYDDLDKAISMT